MAEDGDALARVLDELVVGPGAGDGGLVEEFVVDDVAVAAALVVFSPDEALAFQEGDRFRDGRRADLEPLGELGCGEAARVGGQQTGQHRAVILGRPEAIKAVVNVSSYSAMAWASRPCDWGLPAPLGMSRDCAGSQTRFSHPASSLECAKRGTAGGGRRRILDNTGHHWTTER